MRLIGLLAAGAALAAAQPPLELRLRKQIGDFKGTVSLFAKNLDNGASFGLRADEKVRTASTIKLPVMIEVFAQVAEGKASFTDTILLRDEDKVSGSGVLTEFSSGQRFPIRDLVNLMIVVSDNTATNLLLDRFPADQVNARMLALGLKNTYCLRKIRGDGNALKNATGWSQYGMAEANRKYGIGVTTPREMVQLLEMLNAGKIVSPEASQQMVDILVRQQYKDGIGRRTGEKTKVASKSGALDALRSDVGIVYTPRGRIALAITVDGMPVVDYSADNAGNILIAELTKTLLEALAK